MNPKSKATEKKATKTDLQKAADIFNNIQLGLYIYHLEDINNDRTLRMVAANPATEKLTGVSPKDVIGKTLDENFPELREKGIPQEYAKVIRTQKPFEIEDIYYGDSRVIAGAFSVKAFPLPDNQVGVSFENITKRKTAEKKLEERLFYEIILSEFSTKIVNLPIEYINDEINTVFGSIGKKLHTDQIYLCEFSENKTKYQINCLWTAEETQNIPTLPDCDGFPFIKRKLLNKEIFKFSSIEEIPEKAISEAGYFKQNGIKSSIIIPIAIAEEVIGGIFISTVREKREWSGDLINFFLMIGYTLSNILQRRNTELALSKSEEKFRNIFYSSKDAIIISDFERNILNANPIAAEILGISREKLIGNKTTHFIHDSYHNKVSELTQKIKTQDLSPFELEVIADKNVRIPLEVNSKKIEYEGKDAILSIFRDISERKKAIQALQESEEKYRLLFNNMNAGFAYHQIITDDNNNPVDYKFLDVNPAFEKLTGLKKQHIINKTVLEILPDLEKYWIERYGNVAITGKSVSFTSYSKELEKHYETISYSPKKGYFAVTFSDVTKRVNAEKVIKESEEQLSAIFEGTPVLLALVDEDRRILRINQTGIQQTNRSYEDVVGLIGGEALNCIYALNNPEGCGYSNECKKCVIRKTISATFKTKKNHFKVEGSIKQEKNRRIVESTILISTSLLKYSNETLVLIAIDDITNKKKAELNLKVSEKKYRALFQNANDGILIMKDDVMIMCNNKMMELFRAGVDEIIGKTPVDFSPEFQPDGMKSKDKITIFINQSLNDKPQCFEWLHKRSDGEPFYAEISLNRLILNDVDLLQAIVRDISEKKQLERKIFQTIVETEEKERERFAMELHDGLGPLFSTIKLYAESVQDEHDPEARKSVLRIIQDSVTEAISSLREISNNISPHILHNFGLISAVGSFVEKIKATGKVNINYKSNTTERFQEIIEITLYRVLIELINNTLKHALAKNIRIKIEQAENILNILYSDDGKGMDPDMITNTKTGMGMFNIQNRIKSLNGQIKIDSRKDRGLKITILIKLNDNELLKN